MVTTKLRWNDTGKWLCWDKIVQPPIIDRTDFDEVQVLVAGRAVTHAKHKAHRATHPYALRGCVWVRAVRSADARPLGQRQHLLPVPVPS